MVQVVDASVAIKWFVVEEGREAALRVLSLILEDPSDFAVPELFYFELVNVFHRVLPRPTLEQLELLGQLLQLGVHRFSMTDELLRSIQRFQREGLSGYDGAYVALAEQLKGQWLTFDAKAYAKIVGSGLGRLLS